MAKRPRKIRRPDHARQIGDLLAGDASARTVEADEVWRHFSPDEHIEWVEANCYRDIKGKGWGPLRYSGWQADSIRELLAIDGNGLLVYKTIMPCWPRRCAKSEFAACYDLHRALAYEDQTVVIQANSADQAEDTVYKQIVSIVRNSPKLARLEDDGTLTILADVIQFANGSEIKIQPASEASTYGQKIHVYHNTELCKAVSDAVFQVGASSTGDAWCGVAIVDSNMGDMHNAVHKYVQLATNAKAEARCAAVDNREPNPLVGDPTIGASWISFEDLDDCLRRGCGIGLAGGAEPIHPWLDAAWIRGRYAQMIRSEFRRNHCNQPSGAGEALWTAEQIDPMFARPLPAVIEPAALVSLVKSLGGTEVSIGVGLDRASAFSKNPDRSVLTAVARIVVPDLVKAPMAVYDERGRAVATMETDGSIYLWIGAWEYRWSIADPLKAKLLQIDRAYGIGRCLLESYQASDLGEWCQGQRFGDRVEIAHMTTQAKKQLIEFADGLVKTRRLLASPELAVLRAEWTNYRESAGGGAEGRRRGRGGAQLRRSAKDADVGVSRPANRRRAARGDVDQRRLSGERPVGDAGCAGRTATRTRTDRRQARRVVTPV